MKETRKNVNNREQEKRFFTPLARVLRALRRALTPTFRVVGEFPGTPAVLVARHKNLRGPLTLLTWLPLDVHPFVLSVFFTRESCYRQYRDYTFSVRKGHTPRRFHLGAFLASCVVPTLVRATRSIPVYRDGAEALATLRTALRALERGESVIVFPDVDYTDTGDTAGEIYDGFLYLGEMYKKRTGASLSFLPLAVSEDAKTVAVKAPLVIDRFREERDRAREEIRAALSEE